MLVPGRVSVPAILVLVLVSDAGSLSSCKPTRLPAAALSLTPSKQVCVAGAGIYHQLDTQPPHSSTVQGTKHPTLTLLTMAIG